MKTSIISSKTLSEFATFCRDNELNVGVNITKDAMHLLGKKDINDLDRAIYLLQFLFIKDRREIEKYKFLASKFFGRKLNFQIDDYLHGFDSLLSNLNERELDQNRALYEYLSSPNNERLKVLSYEAISSFESLDLSRPVSINYWVERIMSSSYVEHLSHIFEINDASFLEAYEIYEMKQSFLNNLREEVFIQLFNIKNQNKEVYDYEFLDNQVDLSEKDFLHTDKKERKELLNETRKLGMSLAVKLKREAKRKKKGRIALRRTIRKSLSYGGSMYSTVHQSKVKKKPKLIVFCDISGSMALYSIFGLNFLAGILNAFRNIRAYVFIDGTTEVTDIVRGNSGEEISTILGQWNNYVKHDGHSDYSFSFESLLESINDISSNNLHLLVVGDARNNYRGIDESLLFNLKEKFDRIYWLNPEKEQYWSTGDSIINHFDPICESIQEVRNLNQLKLFVEKLSRKII